MSVTEHTVSELVIHRLDKLAERAANIELRRVANPVDDAALRLLARLSETYASRSSKGFGRFEEDEATYPMPGLVREYVQARSCDLLEVSGRMMALLQVCADEAELECGGAMLFARIREGDTDSLWFALLGEAVGSALNGALELSDVACLDLGKLHAAGRIDLSGWQRGEARYISFLKGRGDAAWFRRFLGCSDVVVALKETKRLVQALNDFVDRERLDPPVRDALLERAHVYLDELGESGEPLALDEMARQVWPEQPERLDTALHNQAVPLASGFVPNRRALRPLVRFSASSEQWKLEFDRSSLQSGAVHYDRTSDTLVLSGLPDYLKKMLSEQGGAEGDQ